jgi:SAM-dependent methyltransferase
MEPLKKLWQPKHTRDAVAPSPEILKRPELVLSFRSHAEWKETIGKHPEIFDSRFVEEIVQAAKCYGVGSKFLQEHIAPREISVEGTNYRETLLARGLNPRQRAVLDLLAEEQGAADIWTYRIYAPEALTPFALLLRGRFPRFLGSEFAERSDQRDALFPVAVEDIMQLSFPNAGFDCVIANEVFEHIPDLPRGIQELSRILRPGGVLLATFPFGPNDIEPAIKSRLNGNTIEHLAEPEYHGNPVDPQRGSLVFQIPGWSIIDQCRAAGFSDAEMIFVSSVQRGITGSETTGVYVLRCRKSANAPRLSTILGGVIEVAGEKFKTSTLLPGCTRETLIQQYWDSHPRFHFFKSVPQKARFLDIGAGAGGLSFWKEWGTPERSDIEMYGVDLSVGEHSARYVQFHAMNLDKEPLPFPDGFFDVILASHLIEHVDHAKLLSEIRRVSRSGALLYLETPTPQSKAAPSRMEFVRQGYPAHTLNFHDDLTHIDTLSLDYLNAALHGVGFKTIKSDVIRAHDLESTLLSAGFLWKDADILTYGLWSRFEFAEYIIGERTN